MDKDQSASAAVGSVSERQAETFVSMTRNYPGGKEKLQLAMGHPEARNRLWILIDELSDEQARRQVLQNRPVWKTLTRSCDNARGYISALESEGHEVDTWARELMDTLAFVDKIALSEVWLQVATGVELTGKFRPTMAEMAEAIHEFGGALCPPWVGPELRLQYKDQPAGKWLNIAMEPIPDLKGSHRVFRIECGVRVVQGGVHPRHNSLSALLCKPGEFLDGGANWVFCIK